MGVGKEKLTNIRLLNLPTLNNAQINLILYSLNRKFVSLNIVSHQLQIFYRNNKKLGMKKFSSFLIPN